MDTKLAQEYGEAAQTRTSFENSVSAADVTLFRFGYKPAQASLFTLLACMFLHGGWMHIFGNMLFLWIYGDNVEARLGRFGYLAAYLGTGAIATLAFALRNSESLTPLVGASGAISGVLGLYLIWFPRNRIRIIYFFFFIGILDLPAYVVLLFYIVVENLLPEFAGAGGSTAYLAHIGGFVAGVIGAAGINMLRGNRPIPRPDVSGWQNTRMRRTPMAELKRTSASEAFTEALQGGRMEEAAHAFARVAREGGAPPAAEDVFRLGQWLYEEQFARDAIAVFRFYMRQYPRGEDLDRVHLGAGILKSRVLKQPQTARQDFLTAIDLARDKATADLAREELTRLGD
jgi:membrane associated rhomboid family serine protease